MGIEGRMGIEVLKGEIGLGVLRGEIGLGVEGKMESGVLRTETALRYMRHPRGHPGWRVASRRETSRLEPASRQAQLPARRGDPAMQATIGDRICIHGNVVGHPDKNGEIVEVHGRHGEPPYLVKFDDGHTRLIFPGPDAVIEHPESS
jgi:hypothetical protein